MEIIAIASLLSVLALIPGLFGMYKETKKLNAEVKRLNIHNVRL